ncbi:MAG: exonuclease domain-containing protein [Oscillospiraceae bacterium]|nr:exonuclease domain-containing protein [Oscillospiraceae bacterium]
MQYIVLDMEWNQPWPGSYAAKKVLPVEIHGEIIQIGAVRMLDDGSIADEFQVLVKPKYYKKLNSRVAKLTGLKDADLKERGLAFPDALQRFRDWIGGECIFLTWGFDDITVLEDNILLHDGEPDWITTWYNAQMIFNEQMECGTSQRALATAMGMMNIEPTRQAHDALGDAYHTALVCKRLDLKRGIEEYQKSLQAHTDGFHGNPPEGCISKSVFHGFEDKAEAMTAMNELQSHCPQCGGPMKNGPWIAQEGRRYMTMASCPEHGRFLIRMRLHKEKDGTTRISRLIYEGASDAAKRYDELSQTKKSRYRSRWAKNDGNK